MLGAFGLAGALLIGYLFVTSATARTYKCDSLLTLAPGVVAPSPGASATGSPTATPRPTTSSTPRSSPGASPTASQSATPTPTPGPNERLGQVTEDLGRNHLTTKTNDKDYGYCPPASGQHYNAAGLGPIKRNFYGQEQEQDPGGWIHNLEHGWVVALYSCGPNGNQCPSSTEMGQLRQFFDQAPKTQGAETCKIPNKVLVARFDSMSTKFALVAWDRVMLMDKFDVNTANQFASQWIDGPSAPEPMGPCP